MQTPTLHTDRLALVAPSGACEDLYEEFYTDAEASAHYGGPLISGAAWARLSADLGTWSLRGFGVWAVQRRETRNLVGVCGYWTERRQFPDGLERDVFQIPAAAET